MRITFSATEKRGQEQLSNFNLDTSSKLTARHPHGRGSLVRPQERLPENPNSILQNSGSSQVYPNGEEEAQQLVNWFGFSIHKVGGFIHFPLFPHLNAHRRSSSELSQCLSLLLHFMTNKAPNERQRVVWAHFL